MSVSKMQAEEPYCGPGFRAGAGPPALAWFHGWLSWKTRFVFWDLPYWKIHRVPHSLDAMHITKNVCESLLGTLLNMPERTKDGPKARADLKSMGIRQELHANDDDDHDDDEAKQDTESHRIGKKGKKTGNYYPRDSL